jgi:hypothetical protein
LWTASRPERGAAIEGESTSQLLSQNLSSAKLISIGKGITHVSDQMKIMIIKNILKGQSHQILDFILLFVKLNWYGTFRRNIFLVFVGKNM